MKTFPLIRTTVTLSLVIAMMIQPLWGLALAAECGEGVGVDPAACSKCGCCEMDHAGEICCCCSADGQFAEPNGSEVANQEIGTAETSIEIADVCLCGLFAPPMNRGSERQCISKLIELRKSNLQLVDLLPETDPKSVGGRDNLVSVPVHADHCSQRHLCIWLI